jgi:GTP-binding protein Era
MEKISNELIRPESSSSHEMQASMMNFVNHTEDADILIYMVEIGEQDLAKCIFNKSSILKIPSILLNKN